MKQKYLEQRLAEQLRYRNESHGVLYVSKINHKTPLKKSLGYDKKKIW